MRITHIDSRLLSVPLSRPRASASEANAGRLNHVSVLFVELTTDQGLMGHGFAYTLQGGGKAMLELVREDLAPLLQGEDPLDHLRLESKVYSRTQSLARGGLLQQAYSALDVALWDLKGKAAGMPLYKLLGGARESAPVYGSDSAWLWMSVGEIIEASQPYLEKGMMGIKVKIGADPESDADRVNHLRDAWGDSTWIGVDANQRYDYPTALALGHFLEEETGVEWFEDPISCDDLAGHRRLASKLDVPLAGGEMLASTSEYRLFLADDCLAVYQPDITRVGGITPFLRLVNLCEIHKRPVSPHILPEISVHLACGLPGVQSVEYMPWFFPLFKNPPQVQGGKLVPPAGPGLGLDIDLKMIENYRVK